jgi:type II secretory pathway component PulK
VSSKGGFALVATIGVLTLISVVAAVVYGSSLAAFRAGVTDVEKSRTYYAAEGAADYAMAVTCPQMWYNFLC